MGAQPQRTGGGRELRLLIVTIGISILALFLLARFRFPADVAPVTPSPAAPALERLAARATYDELAAIITDVQRRVAPAILTLVLGRNEPVDDIPVDATEMGVTPPRVTIAIRIATTSAIAPYWRGTRIDAAGIGANVSVIATDELRQLMLLQVPAGPAALVAASDEMAAVPSYFAFAEPGRGGAALRPVFVSRADVVPDPRWSVPRLALAAGEVQPGSFVFSLAGELLGLSVETVEGASLVPAQSLVSQADRLARDGSVRRGALGFSVQSLTPSLVQATGAASGVIVAYVASEGPAGASLKVGDVIEALNGEPVADAPSFAARVGAVPAGARVVLEIIRQGARIPVELTAIPGGAPARSAELGLTVRPVAGVGVEVVVVTFGSAAAISGLRRGDVITEVNGARPARLADVAAAWTSRDGRPAILGVQRAGRPVVLALRSPDALP